MKKVDHYNFFFFFSLCIKMSETTYCQRNRETIVMRAKDYDQNKKEVLKERVKNKYRELSEEDKNIKKSIEEIDILICQKKKSKN